MWLCTGYPETGFGRSLKRFFKAEEDPNVLSSKATGPADPELCKTNKEEKGSDRSRNLHAVGSGGNCFPTQPVT